MDREIQQQFGAVAERYVVSAVHARGVDLPILVEAAALRPDEQALDLGTAVGHTAFALAPRARSVIGVDLTAEMLAHATRLARERVIDNVCFAQADVRELPFPDAAFDVVTSRLSAHHYAHPERVVGEVARVLRPGGRFILSDTVAPDDAFLDTFINTVELLRDRSHVRDHTIRQWQAMLADAGLTSEVVFAWDIALDFDEWVQRMNTPVIAVTMLRSLLTEAPPAARAMFQVGGQRTISFALKAAIIRAWRHG
jgi:ubiquinone/menaquinone biosynthesis C-methylase UbiE